MIEEWAPIAEFPGYHVSTHGRVYSDYVGRILAIGGVTNGGYIQYHFKKDGRRYARYIHRIMVETFITPDINGLDVDHIDGDNQNNVIWNLEAVTRNVNIQRTYSRSRKTHPSTTPVRIIETGQRFNTMQECADFLNRTKTAVYLSLKNGTAAAGFHVERV